MKLAVYYTQQKTVICELRLEMAPTNYSTIQHSTNLTKLNHQKNHKQLQLIAAYVMAVLYKIILKLTNLSA